LGVTPKLFSLKSAPLLIPNSGDATGYTCLNLAAGLVHFTCTQAVVESSKYRRAVM